MKLEFFYSMFVVLVYRNLIWEIIVKCDDLMLWEVRVVLSSVINWWDEIVVM